ncbi:DUF3238 domain-containing protein [Brevibacillus laterosporus]|uniref:DUF3238 domain-containing protein n=1 Tax=Brevibacillus laterosporus TaxID=1465 RepID=UPI001F0F5A46|nr:DUF3238 domain-containing protein [Brevibacillus laterosporus]WNX31815.1 DUF3238 domain-containing protein [Brevibacillus laterosporus]
MVKGALAIDYEFKVTFKSDGTGFIEGFHDGFPNYEVYINTSSSLGRNKNAIYTYGHKNETARALFPPMDKGVSRRPFSSSHWQVIKKIIYKHKKIKKAPFQLKGNLLTLNSIQ